MACWSTAGAAPRGAERRTPRPAEGLWPGWSSQGGTATGVGTPRVGARPERTSRTPSSCASASDGVSETSRRAPRAGPSGQRGVFKRGKQSAAYSPCGTTHFSRFQQSLAHPGLRGGGRYAPTSARHAPWRSGHRPGHRLAFSDGSLWFRSLPQRGPGRRSTGVGASWRRSSARHAYDRFISADRVDESGRTTCCDRRLLG